MVAGGRPNTWLREVPAMPAHLVYIGPLHEGLDLASLAGAAAERARTEVVMTSALWGMLRPDDRIPPYRLHVCARLVGLDRLEPTWREVLGDLLAETADDDGLLLDLRSPSFQAMGMPTGLGDRTVALRVDQSGAAGVRVGDVIAKRVRGQAAREVLESAWIRSTQWRWPSCSAIAGRSDSIRPCDADTPGR